MGHDELYELKPDPFDPACGPVKLRVCLLTDVKNAPEIRQQLADGKIDAAVIRAELVLEIFQLLAAANRAISCQTHGKMVTKSINTELLYSLCPSKNVTESLRTFGLSDDSKNVILATVNDDSGSKLSSARKKIKGKVTPLAKLREIANYDMIKQAYLVKDPELNKGSIIDAIVTRIVAKDFL